MRKLHSLPGCTIERIDTEESAVTITAKSQPRPSECLRCSQPSKRLHSYYRRSPQDLPTSGRPVRLSLQVRRLYCRNPNCPRRTFTQPLPRLVDRFARRTNRLTIGQSAVGIALGGEADARLFDDLAMPCSPDTILRLIRRSWLPVFPTPRVLGVDDWAIRKGVTYGTILVDLEAHQVIDVLPDRTSETLATWFMENPGVNIITRDRSTDYAKGATQGAPDAIQVAEWWHLLVNLRQMLERYFGGVHARLRNLPALPGELPLEALPCRDAPFVRCEAERAVSRASRARRYRNYQRVMELHEQGVSAALISRELGLNRKTVMRYVNAERFPERAKRRPGRSLLDPFVPHLVRRHQQGCENASLLYREIKQQGYPGSKQQVLKWMASRRRAPAESTPKKHRSSWGYRDQSGCTSGGPDLFSAKHLARLLVQLPDALGLEEKMMLARVEQDAEAATVMRAASWFARMVRERDEPSLDAWLESCKASGIRALQTFVAGLEQDLAAVRSALVLPWSNGQVEGQVTKVKFIKRMMFGRANFDLLHRRVLLAA